MARRPAAMSFVERHGLWTGEQARAAKAAALTIKKHKLELVRFSFADQHGVLRGKTAVAEDAPGLMQAGVTMTTTLLAKDTAHKTAFPVFTPGGGFDMAEMQGAGDFVMVADPATFQVLPWAPNTGWFLCDIFSGTASRCRSRRGRFFATRWRGCRPPASIISRASKSNSICSSWRIRG